MDPPVLNIIRKLFSFLFREAVMVASASIARVLGEWWKITQGLHTLPGQAAAVEAVTYPVQIPSGWDSSVLAASPFPSLPFLGLHLESAHYVRP